MNKSATFKLLLKIVLSAGAIYYVVSRIDGAAIVEKIKSANILFLVLALLMYALSQVAAAHRLRQLFLLIPVKIGPTENIKLYWLGLFYNLFLPGGVGGDGFKAWFIKKYFKVELKKIIGAILSDRVSGLTVIVMMLLFIVPFIDYSLPFQRWFWLLVPFIPGIFFLFLHLFNRSLRPAFISVYFWAIVVQTLQMVSAIIILKSINADMTGHYEAYIFLFFLSAIAGSIPVTLGGIGAREFVFLWGAQYLGIEVSSAIALSLLFYAASALTAFPGIIFTFKPAIILALKRNRSSSMND